MVSVNPNWPSSWTTTSIAASTITNASNATTSSAISNDNISSTLVSISVTYGGTSVEGIKVYLLQDVDGTNYEVIPPAFAFMMPYQTSTTYYRTFPVSGLMVNKFKIKITNDTGASVTCTVDYMQCTTDIV